jgi:hypothetical protein
MLPYGLDIVPLLYTRLRAFDPAHPHRIEAFIFVQTLFLNVYRNVPPLFHIHQARGNYIQMHLHGKLFFIGNQLYRQPERYGHKPVTLFFRH